MSFPKYPKYKDSGVEWLGEVPDGWVVRRYKTVFRERDQRSTEGTETLLSVSAYTGVRPRQEILEADDILVRADSLEGYKVCYPDNLVMNIMLAWNRGLAFSNYHGIVSPAYCVFYVAGVDNPRFLNYLVRSDETILYFKAFSTGVIDSRLRIYPETFFSLFCALPHAAEQRAIASFLDEETAKIDALIEEQRRLIELLKEKRQAVISHTVTKGIHQGVSMRPAGIGVERMIPDSWSVVPLKKFVSYQEGPGIMAADFKDEGVPLIRIAGMRSHFLSLDGCNFLDPSWVDRRFAHFRLKVSDLVISASASMGTACEVGSDCEGAILYTGLIRLRADGNHVSLPFLRFWLQADQFSVQTDFAKSGSTIQHFGPTHMDAMKIALPPLSEQELIAQYLERELTSYDNLLDMAANSNDLLQERRSALISAAVNGKIDVRNHGNPQSTDSAEMYEPA